MIAAGMDLMNILYAVVVFALPGKKRKTLRLDVRRVISLSIPEPSVGEYRPSS